MVERLDLPQAAEFEEVTIMFKALRELFWRLKYRKGRRLNFWVGYDANVEVLIVENRIATSGTVLYRTRSGPNGWDPIGGEFGPVKEASIPALHQKLRGWLDNPCQK